MASGCGSTVSSAHAGAECAVDHSRIHPGTDHDQLRGSRFARLPPQRRDPNMITHRLDLEFSCVTRNLEVHESFDAVHPRRLILEETRQSPGIEWHLRRENQPIRSGGAGDRGDTSRPRDRRRAPRARARRGSVDRPEREGSPHRNRTARAGSIRECAVSTIGARRFNSRISAVNRSRSATGTLSILLTTTRSARRTC